jgi:branched-chain amino acid transport system substrate-binding protein
MFKRWTVSLALVGALGMTAAAAADKQYGPGVTDTEIRIGNTMPYSGPASSYGIIGKAEAAYFAMINDQGGINGRKINFISRDDSYSPPKTVEVVRKLVEEDQVLLLFNPLGTPSNSAIRDYMNERKVPQLFVSSGASKFNDPKHYPWTMGWQPSYLLEARVYARYILENLPDAKIAVLYQNDDFGKDYLAGLREGLGDKSDKTIVATQSYETTDATIDSQIVSLHGSGANVLLTAALPKFAAQTIRKVYDIGWKPTHFLTNVSGSLTTVIQPAGPEKAVGIMTAGYLPDVNDPDVQDAPEYKEWLGWMKKYNTSGNIADGTNVFAYSIAQTLVAVLKACGDNLTRENVMKQAASIRDLKLPMLKGQTPDLDIVISTGADDYAPIKQMRLAKFDGAKWVAFGDLISAESN